MNQNHSSWVSFQVTVNQLSCSSQLPDGDIHVTVQIDDITKITCSGRISEDGLTATWDHPFLCASAPSTMVAIAICFLPEELVSQWDKEQFGGQIDTTVADLMQSEHGWQETVPGLHDNIATISLTCKASDVLVLPDSHDCVEELGTYSHRLHAFIKQCSNMPALSTKMEMGQAMLDLCPKGHPDYLMALRNLVTSLKSYYEVQGNVTDLNRAIKTQERVLKLCPKDHPSYAVDLGNLASCLFSRYMAEGDHSDLKWSIQLQEWSLEICPEDEPGHAIALGNLSTFRYAHYEAQGDILDLNRVIEMQEKRLHLCPPGHADHSLALGSLATSLGSRFEVEGNISDLNWALELDEQSLECCPPDHPDYPLALANLATSFHSCYLAQSNIADLDRAIDLQEQRLALCPPGHPSYDLALGNFATYLWGRYEAREDLSDLNRALEMQETQLNICPPTHPHYALALGNFGLCLSSRFQALGNVSDLNRAIKMHEERLGLCPAGHPQHLLALFNLAIALKISYRTQNSKADLQKAVKLFHQELDVCPVHHQHFASAAQGLAQTIILQSHSPDDAKDYIFPLEDAFKAYGLLKGCGSAVSLNLWNAAKAWINDAEEHSHPSILEAYQFALLVLDRFTSIQASLDSRHEKMQTRVADLANVAFSCAVEHGEIEMAVELLEQGRGILWNQLARSDISLIGLESRSEEGHDLIREFDRLSAKLRKHAEGGEDTDAYWRVLDKWNAVVDDIRNQEGFSRFLLPPCFDDLREAARDGPVIIVNASKRTCDAVIVLHALPPVRVSLPSSLADINQLCSQFSELIHDPHAIGLTGDRQLSLEQALRDLWGTVVEPIVAVLQRQRQLPLGSRIWWCPTSELALLPFHATGPYLRDEPEKDLPNLYVSSYTPSLSALVRARERARSRKEAREAGTSSSAPDAARDVLTFAAIGQGDANNAFNLRALPEVDRELQRIREETHMPSNVAFSSITGEAATIDAAMQACRENRWVHLACHGAHHDRRPFASSFVMRDGPLTLLRIIQERARDTASEFAFLSSCHTAVGDASTPDEVLHLAAGMQFAGFSGVIGTLWMVNDSVAHEVVMRFYREMFKQVNLDCEHAATALNVAVRASGEVVPLEERLVFIHIGV